jgi:predicted RNA binding protein YcfA (HicA-like mRNA interferase family)
MRRSVEPAMSARDLIRFAERDGWSASVTRGSHIRLDHHPEATMPIFAASTPSDHRASRTP